MTEPKAGYSLNPTIGVSSGLVHTDVPYRRTILAPDGESGAVVSGAPALPATAFAFNIDYPLTYKGPFTFTPGIQGGGTRWGQYQSWFGSIYNRFGIDFGHDYFSLGARVGYGGFSTRHNNTETIRHGVDIAGDVIVQLSRHVGFQVTGGGRTEIGGHSQTFILGGLTVRLGRVSSVDPADLASGTRALGLAQSKYEELVKFLGGMTGYLKNYYGLLGADIDIKWDALGHYLDWIRFPHTPSGFNIPALNPTLDYINLAVTFADKAIPSPHAYKDAEMAKIKSYMAGLNAKLAQPALDILFFMEGSIFDDLLKGARAAKQALASGDTIRSDDTCKAFGKNLYNMDFHFNKLKPFLSPEQSLKIADMARHVECLKTGTMCGQGSDLSLTLPRLEEQFKKVMGSEKALCRYTNGKGASK
jgi:hypothetical protein